MTQHHRWCTASPRATTASPWAMRRPFPSVLPVFFHFSLYYVRQIVLNNGNFYICTGCTASHPARPRRCVPPPPCNAYQRRRLGDKVGFGTHEEGGFMPCRRPDCLRVCAMCGSGAARVSCKETRPLGRHDSWAGRHKQELEQETTERTHTSLRQAYVIPVRRAWLPAVLVEDPSPCYNPKASGQGRKLYSGTVSHSCAAVWVSCAWFMTWRGSVHDLCLSLIHI